MSEERKLKDVSRADPQCYMCPGEHISCSNCMMQHQLDRISKLEERMKDIIDDIPKFNAKKWDESYHSINHFIGKVGELEGKYKALLNGMEILNNKITELGWKLK